MRYEKVVILSPPFYSHFSPLLSLARAFGRAGAEVAVACSEAFAPRVRDAELGFIPLIINRNANTGIAQRTDQARAEAERLEAFLRATREGPVATLMLQARQRQQDMLADPERLLDEIRAIARREQADLFVIDQLSYAASLALYCLKLPFITFCPGHPTYIPRGDQLFGVPYAWPREFDIAPGKLRALRTAALKVERRFTALFNEIIAVYDRALPLIPNAFRFASSKAILFNYPDFEHLHREDNGVQKIFMGYAFESETLDAGWEHRLEEADRGGPKVLITLGTFLSAREDVLEQCIRTVARAEPESTIIVSAGASLDKLAHLQSEQIILEEFLPQKALLPHVDLVIYHGGCNTFTETLFHGKPTLILPFSSDQFSIAHDAQQHELAECVNPNLFAEEELAAKMARMLSPERRQAVQRWQQHVAQRGPNYAVRLLQGGELVSSSHGPPNMGRYRDGSGRWIGKEGWG